MRRPGRNDPCWCGSGQKYKKCHLDSDNRGLTQPPAEAPVPGLVAPGIVSPIRPVPLHIPRPSYAATGLRPRSNRSCLKRPDEIPRMRAACAIARQVLDTMLAAVAPGVTTDELDRIAHEATLARGAYPSTLNYQGYTKSSCTSVNEVICHGIPDSRPLKDGDIINCDMTVFFDGMHGDCSDTVFVGTPSAESRRLVEVTYECMMKGIEVVKPGQPFNAIGKVIEEHAKRFGYGVVRDFTGHGIGEDFHMAPHVLHYFERRDRNVMEAGMTFTVEPMINAGSAKCEIWPDNWTAVTADRKRSAQFEHTVLVVPGGVEILTAAPEGPFFKRA